MQRQGVSYEKYIIPLIEAGALSSDHDLAIYISKELNLEFHNDKLFGVVMNYDDTPALFQREAYSVGDASVDLLE